MVFIRIDQYLTGKLPKDVGVPQADRLAPIRFTVFIVDLDWFSRKTKVSVVFYADDLALGHRDLSKIQQALLTLENDCVNNDLEVKTRKTKVMKIRKAGKLNHYDHLIYRNTVLEFVNSFKYLGVILQTNANPTKHLKHLRRRALVGTITLSMKMDLTEVQLSTARTLFESTILPSATYCQEIFVEKLTESVMQRHIKILQSTFTRDGQESQEDYRQNNWWPGCPTMTILDHPIPTNLAEKKSLVTIAMDVIICYVILWDVTRL